MIVQVGDLCRLKQYVPEWHDYTSHNLISVEKGSVVRILKVTESSVSYVEVLKLPGTKFPLSVLRDTYERSFKNWLEPL